LPTIALWDDDSMNKYRKIETEVSDWVAMNPL
jgi:hypothetical protein